MSGGWFDDIGSWAGRQSWLPGFLGGAGTAQAPPETFGPIPPVPQPNSRGTSSIAPVDPAVLDQDAQRQRVGQALLRYRQAMQTQQPNNRMTEWFGPRRVR
jgi:hypothetical protein